MARAAITSIFLSLVSFALDLVLVLERRIGVLILNWVRHLAIAVLPLHGVEVLVCNNWSCSVASQKSSPVSV